MTSGAGGGEGWFQAGGVRLFRRWWRPDRPPRAVLINLHGLGDHSGLYPMLADALVPRGIAVEAYDQRGNGRSPGQRGYVERWSDLLADLDCFVDLVRSESPAPVFLLGNSLGGLVMLEWAEQAELQPAGLIGVGAALGDVGVPAPLLLLGRILARVWPRFSLQTGMDLSALSRDPRVVETVLADPLFHRAGTARLAADVPAAIERVHRRAAAIRCPLLLLHGSADRMVDPEGSRRLWREAGAPDRRLIEYPGGYHALLADLNADAVLLDCINWIEAHLPPA